MKTVWLVRYSIFVPVYSMLPEDNIDKEMFVFNDVQDIILSIKITFAKIPDSYIIERSVGSLKVLDKETGIVLIDAVATTLHKEPTHL